MVWPTPQISTADIWGHFPRRGDTMGADFNPQKRVILWTKHGLCKNDVPCMYIFYFSQGRLNQSSSLRYISQHPRIYFLNVEWKYIKAPEMDNSSLHSPGFALNAEWKEVDNHSDSWNPRAELLAPLTTGVLSVKLYKDWGTVFAVSRYHLLSSPCQCI